MAAVSGLRHCSWVMPYVLVGGTSRVVTCCMEKMALSKCYMMQLEGHRDGTGSRRVA